MDEVVPPEPSIASAEIGYIERFLQDLQLLGTDSKAARLLEDLRRLLERRETIIIFTVYTDTMDWLREKLRAVYGSQVACYSGRAGEVWDGQDWQKIPKEDLKAAFAEEKIKILLGTEAMSEGLNLQTCGMLINYDMPWNPMRVEQRIGRIDRIEQRYPDVWIYNYFYADTVEADVYKALEGRISWFETVIGDLQPILSRVAATIQDVAMRGREERPELLSSAISDIKKHLDEQQAQALRLDEYLALDESPPIAFPQAVTRQEIERLLLNFSTPQIHFQPSPGTVGEYLLQLEDKHYLVTFDSELFSRNPDELHLMTYGEPLFHRLIEMLASTQAAGLPPWILRVDSQSPEYCAWYLLEGSSATPLLTLSDLEKALARKSVSFGPPAKEAAWTSFNRIVVERTKREHESYRLRLKARSGALKERGRQLLLKAAYLNTALSLQPGTGESGETAALFTVQAVINLRQYGFPFTALIAQVTVAGIEPSPADAYWEEVKSLRPEALRRRFEEVKRRAKELVLELHVVAA